VTKYIKLFEDLNEEPESETSDEFKEKISDLFIEFIDMNIPVKVVDITDSYEDENEDYWNQVTKIKISILFNTLKISMGKRLHDYPGSEEFDLYSDEPLNFHQIKKSMDNRFEFLTKYHKYIKSSISRIEHLNFKILSFEFSDDKIVIVLKYDEVLKPPAW